MRTFKTGMGRFYEPIQILDGPATRAIISRGDMKDKPRFDSPDAPMVTARVLPDSLLQSGNVISYSGEIYLAADHSQTPDFRVHHLFHCARQVSWTRKTTATDTLTGLPMNTGTETQPHGGPIWVMTERVRQMFLDTALHMNGEQTLVVTGYDVQANDFLDGQLVKRTASALGVRILELVG